MFIKHGGQPYVHVTGEIKPNTHGWHRSTDRHRRGLKRPTRPHAAAKLDQGLPAKTRPRELKPAASKQIHAASLERSPAEAAAAGAAASSEQIHAAAPESSPGAATAPEADGPCRVARDSLPAAITVSAAPSPQETPSATPRRRRTSDPFAEGAADPEIAAEFLTEVIRGKRRGRPPKQSAANPDASLPITLAGKIVKGKRSGRTKPRRGFGSYIRTPHSMQSGQADMGMPHPALEQHSPMGHAQDCGDLDPILQPDAHEGAPILPITESCAEVMPSNADVEHHLLHDQSHSGHAVDVDTASQQALHHRKNSELGSGNPATAHHLSDQAVSRDRDSQAGLQEGRSIQTGADGNDPTEAAPSNDAVKAASAEHAVVSSEAAESIISSAAASLLDHLHEPGMRLPLLEAAPASRPLVVTNPVHMADVGIEHVPWSHEGGTEGEITLEDPPCEGTLGDADLAPNTSAEAASQGPQHWPSRLNMAVSEPDSPAEAACQGLQNAASQQAMLERHTIQSGSDGEEPLDIMTVRSPEPCAAPELPASMDAALHLQTDPCAAPEIQASMDSSLDLQTNGPAPAVHAHPNSHVDAARDGTSQQQGSAAETVKDIISTAAGLQPVAASAALRSVEDRTSSFLAAHVAAQHGVIGDHGSSPTTAVQPPLAASNSNVHPFEQAIEAAPVPASGVHRFSFQVGHSYLASWFCTDFN